MFSIALIFKAYICSFFQGGKRWLLLACYCLPAAACLLACCCLPAACCCCCLLLLAAACCCLLLLAAACCCLQLACWLACWLAGLLAACLLLACCLLACFLPAALGPALDNSWIRGRSGGRSGVVRGVVRVVSFVFFVCSFFYLLLFLSHRLLLLLFSLFPSFTQFYSFSNQTIVAEWLFVMQSSAGRRVVCSARGGLSRVCYNVTLMYFVSFKWRQSPCVLMNCCDPAVTRSWRLFRKRFVHIQENCSDFSPRL